MQMKKPGWNGLLPFLCVGYLAGVIATVLPMLQTVLLSVGIGALTGAVMRYAQPRDHKRE
jgi:hypothetical protein